MNVNIQSVNFTVDQKLVDFIQKRLDKLENYYDRVVSADVYLKVENTSEKENKIVEVKVHVPGDEFMVKKQCKSFEEGVDTAAEFIRACTLKEKRKNESSYLNKIFQKMVLNKKINLYICSPLEIADFFYAKGFN